jgi:hypothetical protein
MRKWRIRATGGGSRVLAQIQNEKAVMLAAERVKNPRVTMRLNNQQVL